MPDFTYTARTTSGQPSTGVIAAATLTEALRLIRAEGKFPVAIRPAEAAGRSGPAESPRHGLRISRPDVIHLSTQLAIMIDTGVTLSEALECIARQSDKPNVAALVNDIAQFVHDGGNLSDALARHPRSFPTLFVALIRASEKSGMMSRLLNRATAYLRDEQEILRKVKGALTYPLIMFTFALVTTTFLLAFVMPRFTAIYAMKQAVLPLPTRVLMGASGMLLNHYLLVITAVVSMVAALALALRTPTGGRVWHYVQLNVPLFGGMYRRLHLTRGLRMVGTLAGAGVSLMECVTTAGDLCPNVHFRSLWQRVGENIQGGRQLSDPLFESPLVPRPVAQMIASGEKSGKLAAVLEQIAGYAEQELKEEITALTRYIEPVMIVLMGAIIGGVCLALLLPIFSISKVMAH